VRIDSSEYFFGLRLNMYIAIIGTLGGLIWFAFAQRRPDRPVVVNPGGDSDDPVQSAAAATPAPAAETEEAEGVATLRSEE
jgi:hypothetical protein